MYDIEVCQVINADWHTVWITVTWLVGRGLTCRFTPGPLDGGRTSHDHRSSAAGWSSCQGRVRCRSNALGCPRFLRRARQVRSMAFRHLLIQYIDSTRVGGGRGCFVGVKVFRFVCRPYDARCMEVPYFWYPSKNAYGCKAKSGSTQCPTDFGRR